MIRVAISQTCGEAIFVNTLALNAPGAQVRSRKESPSRKPEKAWCIGAMVATMNKGKDKGLVTVDLHIEDSKVGYSRDITYMGETMGPLKIRGADNMRGRVVWPVLRHGLRCFCAIKTR